ncbi:MAG: aminotransferase class V-fold PLP-dependent enzyme [Rhodospirillales bacterium]
MTDKNATARAATEQAATEEDFQAFRNGFPALKAQTYLSICDKMIMHQRVRASVDSFLDHLTMASANRVDHEVMVTGSREKFAELMNVAPSTVAATRNVSDGINSVACSLPWIEGDNVVVTAEAEHPNSIYPWLRQQKRGLEVRMIPANPDGSMDIDGMLGAMDKRTKLLTCASVTYAPGHRSDLARLGKACSGNDTFFLVDGVQSAGILHHDFGAEHIDGFATSTSKGLLGLYGYGFLYVSEKWIDRMEPAYLSRPAIDMDNEAHSAMGSLDYDLKPDSRRFEVGSYNLAGAYAANASLDLLLGLGSADIEKRVLGLAGLLHEGLTDAGFPPAVPGSGPNQSHILTVGEIDAGSHGFSTDPEIERLSATLKDAKVAHTIRRGQVRFAIHAFNDESDIRHVVDCVREMKSNRTA